MRAKEFINNEYKLVFETTELEQSQILSYYKERQRLCDRSPGDNMYFSPGIFSSGIRRSVTESVENNEVKPFIDRLLSYDTAKTIKVGDYFSALEVEIGFGWKEIDVTGFVEPKQVTKINLSIGGKIKNIEFSDGTVYPRQTPATYSGKPVVYGIYFNTVSEINSALTMLKLSTPNGWDLTIDSSLSQNNINEGGWANPATQNTHITPVLVDQVFKILHVFVDELNQFLTAKNMPTVELGQPCGSTTYYKRDLVQDPEREYGDVDVNLFIPRIDGMTNNANADLYKKNIQEFCEKSKDYQTSNGTNVIVQIAGDYVQVDFITAYFHNKEWIQALAPEYRVKGVLCNALYSSLGEVLNLSIGGTHGVQAKFQDEKLVPFRTVKNVELKTITNNPKTWALDIAKFLGCTKISPTLKAYPGMIGEIRVSDIVNSIKGIAETLSMNRKGNTDEILRRVKATYLEKIQKAIDSSKYDKAATASAIEKAEKTKKLLANDGHYFASLFDK